MLVKYYFGRLNFIASMEEKRDFIINGLKTKKFVQIRDHVWGFFNISEHETNSGSVISGFLAKYKPSYEETVAETETHKLKNEAFENVVVAKSQFIIFLDSNVIAYHPVTGINRSQFCKNFKKIFEEAYGTLVDVEIQSIHESLKFIEEIKKFKLIRKVSIYLHPSNPHTGDKWKYIQERLENYGVESYNEEYTGDYNKDGLINIYEDPDINNKISMSEDGYGETKAEGIVDDEIKVISTRDNPMNTRAPHDTEPDLIIDYLKHMYEKILERFK